MTSATILDEAWLRAHPLPEPDPDSDKNQRGRVLVVGGARFVPGALRLTGEAALRAGAGKLQLATVEAVSIQLGVLVPEAAMIRLPADSQGEIDASAYAELGEAISTCDVLILGPGMSKGDNTQGLVESLISAPRRDLSLVLDAAALSSAAQLARQVSAHKGRVVMTPHLGELATLLGRDVDTIAAAPVEHALIAAARFNAVVVLKAAVTHIAAPDRSCLAFTGDCVGLATSGSGDVLAGIIGGFLARGANVLTAAAWGVWLHNAAGRKLEETKGFGFLARELVELAPVILHRFGADPAK